MTAGGSSLPEVQRLLAVLAAGRRCAETGTAFGEGAAAIASTASSLVTVERDPKRAAGGFLVTDDLTPSRAVEGDPVRELLFAHPQLTAVELLTTPQTAAIIAVRR